MTYKYVALLINSKAKKYKCTTILFLFFEDWAKIKGKVLEKKFFSAVYRCHPVDSRLRALTAEHDKSLHAVSPRSPSFVCVCTAEEAVRH